MVIRSIETKLAGYFQHLFLQPDYPCTEIRSVAQSEIQCSRLSGGAVVMILVIYIHWGITVFTSIMAGCSYSSAKALGQSVALSDLYSVSAADSCANSEITGLDINYPLSLQLSSVMSPACTCVPVSLSCNWGLWLLVFPSSLCHSLDNFSFQSLPRFLLFPTNSLVMDIWLTDSIL